MIKKKVRYGSLIYDTLYDTLKGFLGILRDDKVGGEGEVVLES
jgi:hypothetical protein